MNTMITISIAFFASIISSSSPNADEEVERAVFHGLAGIREAADDFIRQQEEVQRLRDVPVEEDHNIEPIALYNVLYEAKKALELSDNETAVSLMNQLDTMIDSDVPIVYEADLIETGPFNIDECNYVRSAISRAVVSYALFSEDFDIHQLHKILDLDLQLPGSIPKDESDEEVAGSEMEEKTIRPATAVQLLSAMQGTHKYINRYTPGCYSRMRTLIINLRRYLKGDFDGIQQFADECLSQFVIFSCLKIFASLFKVEQVEYAVKNANPFAAIFGAFGMFGNVFLTDVGLPAPGGECIIC